MKHPLRRKCREGIDMSTSECRYQMQGHLQRNRGMVLAVSIPETLQKSVLFSAPPPPPSPPLHAMHYVHYLWFAFVCFLIRSHPPLTTTPRSPNPPPSQPHLHRSGEWGWGRGWGGVHQAIWQIACRAAKKKTTRVQFATAGRRNVTSPLGCGSGADCGGAQGSSAT